MFISTINALNDREFVKDEKGRYVAVFEKGKCVEVAHNLYQKTFYNTYFLKRDVENYLEDYDSNYPINFYRQCINAKEYLKSFEELKYQPCKYRFLNDIYEEKETRIKYASLIEFLEKLDYWELLDFKPLRKMDKKEVAKFLKFYDKYRGSYEDTKKDILNAFKRHLSVEDYKVEKKIEKVEKALKIERNDAKYFIKKYHDFDLNYALNMYKDTIALNDNQPIGFPKDLRQLHDDLLKKDNEKKQKDKMKQKCKINFKIISRNKKYEVKLLRNGKDYSKYSNIFNNCIYRLYLDKAIQGKYEVAIIYKNNKPYACVGFDERNVMDQLYLKNNKPLENKEYNLIKRSLICLN